MKITDKIVTLVGLPSMTNVVWHNPDTNELKIYGKNGWEVVGGSPGDSTSGGYPIVTVEDGFNITAEPNTFYNIKNNADSLINIIFGEGFYVDSKRKHIMFTGDATSSSTEDIVFDLLANFGGVLVDDTSIDGYKYRMDFDLNAVIGGETSEILSIYFSDEIKSGGSVEYYVKQNPSIDINLDIITHLDNIVVLNDGIDYLLMVNIQNTLYPHIFIEENNDKEEYNHKYAIIGAYGSWIGFVYTIEPYHLASNFYTSNGEDLSLSFTIHIIPNIDIHASTVVKEFVFNINSPTNIVFSNLIKWNNDDIPDLTQEGICTISIVNGVGCYTFVNN